MSGKHLWATTGFLLPFFKRLFKFLMDNVTPLGWIKRIDKRLECNKALVEIYYLFWLLLLILLFFILRCPAPYWAQCIILIFALVRLYDIIVSATYLSFFRDETPSFPARSLILLFINYVEILLILSIANFNFSSLSDPDIYKSFQLSVSVFVPLVPVDMNSLDIPYWLFLSEIGVSLFVHITIIQRVLSYFRQSKLR